MGSTVSNRQMKDNVSQGVQTQETPSQFQATGYCLRDPKLADEL